MFSTVLCCFLHLRGVSANGGKTVTSKRDQHSSSRSSELSGYSNCEPKKIGKKNSVSFQDNCVFCMKKKLLHTLSCMHTQIHRQSRSHISACTLTRTPLLANKHTHMVICPKHTQKAQMQCTNTKQTSPQSR